MKARPILFSAPMVRALLEGRKTQTRRIVKCLGGIRRGDRWAGPANPASGRLVYRDGAAWDDNPEFPPTAPIAKCPYGQPGDLLWVKETHAIIHLTGAPAAVYAATDQRAWKYRPSIHMPRWASRLTLELTEVRVQRLQEISEADALAEGIERLRYPERGDWGWPQARYRELWNSINGPSAWDANPWVWCLSFRVHLQNIDEFIKSREAA